MMDKPNILQWCYLSRSPIQIYFDIHQKKNLWNFRQNTIIFAQENAFENIVCKMTAILFSP